MRAIVVGGAGAMGRVIVRDLARSEAVELVTIGDVDGDRAAKVARETSRIAAADVRPVECDVAGEGFVRTLSGHDVAIASVAYRLNPTVAEACLAAGCDYIDLGGLFHVTLQVLELNERYAAAGRTGITCMGGSPGITNLLAVQGAREIDAARQVHVRLGSLDPSVANLPLPIPYSLETILDEFTLPAMAYRDGRFVEIPPLGEPEEVHFPSPLGSRTAYTTLHSEVATLPRRFPDVQRVTFKIAFEEGLVERFRLLADVGLASTEPLTVSGATVRPRDVLAALGRRLPQAAGTQDVECLRVVLEGERDGAPATAVAECLVQPDPEDGLGAGARDTGIPPSIVAQMLAAGEVKGPGMFAPEEAVDAERFFARLAERGIVHTVIALPRPARA